jgi:hypothetical protein
MKEHEHRAKNEPTTKPTHDDVARKAYSIYLKEGRPQGNGKENWLEAEKLNCITPTPTILTITIIMPT